jgi:hypothetical protein
MSRTIPGARGQRGDGAREERVDDVSEYMAEHVYM